jgi:ABC-type transporter Mla MlaB component
MLRVTETRTEHGTWLILEGRLTGPWVDEVKRCWKRLLARGTGQATFIDVREVSFIDESGKALLSEMHHAGARLVSSGVLMNSVVQEIKKRT